MKEVLIERIIKSMSNNLNSTQLNTLKNYLELEFLNYEITQKFDDNKDDLNLVKTFLNAKRIEGLSEKSLNYYSKTIYKMLSTLNKNEYQITTDDLRNYLSNYQKDSECSQITIDNIRRILSSYFSFLEDEDIILKSPIRRIHKIKTCTSIKEVFTDEDIEKLRDSCTNKRDLCLIEILASTGIRIGELVNLDRSDINFNERECKVLGKGNKERIVYFDARTKVHLEQYLKERKDTNKALFVSLCSPYKRITISSVELKIKKIGIKALDKRVHPHKFRRSMATKAIDKGMPIEQLQVLLGHKRIDTTLQYAMVNQNNVKQSHRRYIG